MKEQKASETVKKCRLKTEYFDIYISAYNNALDLLSEAKILFDNKCFPRAYFLAFTALEEISKSQIAADVYTGLVTEEEFIQQYREHEAKINRMAWAHEDANSSPHCYRWVGPDRDDVEEIVSRMPKLKRRMNSLYVGLNLKDMKPILPEEKITKEDAKGIIHIVDVALFKIMEMTEYWGHQIGTKGFMK